MKVFKYLVILADISVGFLGLFFVIFAVTRPALHSSPAQRQRLEQALHQLRAEIRRLEEIKLAKAGAAKKPAGNEAAKIIVAVQAIAAEIAGRKAHFSNAAEFAAASRSWRWPDSVVLYVDHRVPFEQVVNVIDALKGINETITVQIAALAR
jgi:biopolymer transport protein ExbD